jgi:hypothetical protein
MFCERVLEDKDGVLSAIRIVDRIIHHARGPDSPEEMPTASVALTILVMLKAGAARGRNALRLRPEAPSGLRLPEVSFPVLFEGEDRGVNVVLPIQFEVDQEGVYWFDVTLDDALITRMPLRIVYQRIALGGNP